MASTATSVLALWLLCAPRAEAALEEIEATPTNTNGIEIGELSFMQLLLLMLVFLKLVTLYSLGVLPIEIDLGASFTGFTSERGLVDKDVSPLSCLPMMTVKKYCLLYDTARCKILFVIKVLFVMILLAEYCDPLYLSRTK